MNTEYLKAVDAYLSNDRTGVERFLHSKLADRCERGLIEARMRIKADEYSQASSILEGLSPQTPLLRGDVAFLRAGLLSFESKWEEAAVEAHVAIGFYLQCDYARGLFIGHYNLSVYYNRIGLEKLSLEFLERAEKYQQTPNQKGLVLRALACDASKKLDYAKAIAYLEDAFKIVSELDPMDQTTLEYVAADIYFRAGHSEVSLSFLERLNHSKLVRDKARVRFEITVLRNLLSNAPKIVETQIPESVASNQEHSLQWKILQGLQSGDLLMAENLWIDLVGLFPLKYCHKFKTVNPSDQNTIFMTAVQRLLRPLKTTDVSVLGADGKQRALIELLVSSPVFLRKEEIIERIWEVSYEPSFDNRFYKLINRIRKDHGIKIVVVSGTYRIIQ